MVADTAATTNPVSSDQPPKARRVRLLRSERRRQLIDVASQIVARDGVSALTMEGLAKAAKISKPVVYSHFADRSALLVGLLQAYWAELDANVPQEPAPGEELQSFLERSIDAYFEFAMAKGQPLRELLRRSFDEPAVEEVMAARNAHIIGRMMKLARNHAKIDEERAWASAIMSKAALQAASIAAGDDPSRAPLLRKAYLDLSDFLLGIN